MMLGGRLKTFLYQLPHAMAPRQAQHRVDPGREGGTSEGIGFERGKGDAFGGKGIR